MSKGITRIIHLSAVVIAAGITLFGMTACDNSSSSDVNPSDPPQIQPAARNKPLIVQNKHKAGEVLVKFKESSTGKAAGILKTKLGSVDIKSFKRPKQLKRSPLDQWRHVFLPAGQNVKGAMASLRGNPNILAVVPNYKINAAAVPNDPRFGELWGLHNIGQSMSQIIGVPDADINATEAWDVVTGSDSVIVAVLDTGIDYNHPDLAPNMWINIDEEPGDGIDNDSNDYIDDVYGYDFAYRSRDPMDYDSHGTHVAGTIGAAGNNLEGVVGVSWNVKLMAVKILRDTGEGDVTSAINAISYAVNNGAKILNNSWGYYLSSILGDDPLGAINNVHNPLRDAIQAANNAGVLFVAAAGNDNGDNDEIPFFPASFDGPEVDNIISVAATNNLDAKAEFSNFGAVSVDIGAPGDFILSTTPGGLYGYKGGTSMATPHVSGVAALILAQNPTRTTQIVKSWLLDNSDRIPAMNGKTTSGSRLNATNSLNCTPTLFNFNVVVPTDNHIAIIDDQVNIRARLNSCGDPINGSTVTASFSNGAASIELFDDGQHGDGNAGDGVFGTFWSPATVEDNLVITYTATVSGYTPLTLDKTVHVRPRVRYQHEVAPYNWVDASSGISHTLTDEGTVTLPIGFPFDYYGKPYANITVSANGVIGFGVTPGSTNIRLPDPTGVNNFIAAYWDDLNPALGGNIYTLVDGVEPNRRMIISWVNVPHYGGAGTASFQAILHETTGDIVLQHMDVDFGNSAWDFGASATVGLEDFDGVNATMYAYNQRLVDNGAARRFYPALAAQYLTYNVTIDASSVASGSGYIVFDMIDGDGINNNHSTVYRFSTDGDAILDVQYIGDASGTLIPGPAHIGDAQFVNELLQPLIFGNQISFLMPLTTEGIYQPFPDTLSVYILDASGLPCPTTDPFGTNTLFSIEIKGLQPAPYVFECAYATATLDVVGAPIANPGGPYEIYNGVPFTLDGTGSSDPEGATLTYQWDFGDGTTGTGVQPVHTYTNKGIYTVSLVVNDGQYLSKPVTTTVNVVDNYAPVANAGPDQIVLNEDQVVLDGRGSYDPDGDIQTYQWKEAGQSTVGLAGKTEPVASFTANSGGYTLREQLFQLTVTDDKNEIATDEVIIKIINPDVDDDQNGLADGWEEAYFGSEIVDPNDDPDGDGLSNKQEHDQGTDPHVANTIPSAVEHLAAIPGNQSNRIIWDGSKGSAKYNLYWSTSPGVTKTNGNKITNVESTYVHTGLSNGTTYYYVITAENNAGESVESGEISAIPGSIKAWHGEDIVAFGVTGAVSAMDSLGNIFVAYSAFNSIWLEEYRSGTGWKKPKYIGDGSSPKIAMSPNGNAVIGWIGTGSRWLWLRTYSRDKDRWTVAVQKNGTSRDSTYNQAREETYGRNGTNIEDFDISISNHGNAVAAFTQWELRSWQPVINSYGTFYIPGRDPVSTNQGWDGVWDLDDTTSIGDSSDLSVAISEDGQTAMASWTRSYCPPTDLSCTKINVARASVYYPAVGNNKSSDYPWSTDANLREPRPIQLDDGTAGIIPYAPALKSDTDGDTLIVWAQNTGGSNDIYSRQYVRTTDTWEATPVPVGAGLNPDLIMEPNGEALVAWRETGQSDSVKSKRYVPGSGWDELTNDTLAGDSQIPYLSLSRGGDGSVKLLWRDAANKISVNYFDKLTNTWVAGDQINTNTIEALSNIHISSDNYGDSVITWQQQGYIYANHYAVSHLPKSGNQLPVANAGNDIHANEGESVVLDGLLSTDPDGILFQYQWVQTGGEQTIEITGQNTPEPSLSLPYIPVNSQLTATFELTVTDNMGASTSDTVLVTVHDNNVNNSPPVIVNSAVTEVKSLETVNIDASASYDTDGMVVSYSWYQISGPDAAIIGTGLSLLTFTAPIVSDPAVVTVRLTVMDDDGDITQKDIAITVIPDYSIDSDGDGLSDAWEVGNFSGLPDMVDPLSQSGTDDYDGDGINNLQEYLEGTDPIISEAAPAPVVHVVASSGDGSSVISWPNSIGTISYDLYWGTAPDLSKATGSLISNATRPYNHTGLVNGTTYYYLVVAKNQAGESVESPIASATPALKLWQGPTSLGFSSNLSSFAFYLKMDGLGNAIITAPVNAVEDYVVFDRYQVGQGWKGPVTVRQQAGSNLRGGVLDVDIFGNAIVSTDNYTLSQAAVSQYSMATRSWASHHTYPDPGGLTNPDIINVAKDSRDSATVVMANQATPSELWVSDYSEITQTWSTPYLLTSNDEWLKFMDITQSGYGVMVLGDNTGSLVTQYTTDRGWLSPVSSPIHLPENSLMGMDEKGNLIAVYYSAASAPADAEISAVIRKPDGTWSTPTPLHALSGTNKLWALDVASNGSAIAVWHLDTKGKAAGFYTARYHPVSGWESPIQVDFETEVSLDVAIDELGNAVVAWVDRTRKGDVLYGQHLSAGSAVWADPVQLSDILGTVQQGVQVATDPAGNTTVAWDMSGDTGYFYYANRYSASSASENARPVANAGADLIVNEGDSVTLDGSASSDPASTVDPAGGVLGYKWIQVAGPSVLLADISGATLSFTAPLVTETTYVGFALTVTDDYGETSTDIVSVKINDVPPI